MRRGFSSKPAWSDPRYTRTGPVCQTRVTAECRAITPGRSEAGWPGNPRSVEDRVAGAGALQLEEPVDAGDQQDAVPQLGRGLAARDRGHHRAEDGHAVDRDDGGADVVADPVDALGV